TDGGYIVVGHTDSYGAGNDDFWLVKVDPDGNLEWDKTFGGNLDDMAHSVQQTTDGGYIAVGYTYSYGAGQTDFYIIKLNPEQIIDTAPPSLIVDFSASDGEDGQSTLTWTNPNEPAGTVVVVRRDDHYPSNHSDGTVVHETPMEPGAHCQYVDGNLTNGVTYYYAVFSRDAAGNWNDMVEPGKNADTATPGITQIKAADLFVVPGSVLVNHQDLMKDIAMKIGNPLTMANQICVIATVGNAGPDDVYANVEIYNDKNEKLIKSGSCLLKKGTYKVISVTIDLQENLDEWTSFKVQIKSIEAEEVDSADNVVFSQPIQYYFLTKKEDGTDIFDIHKDTFKDDNPSTQKVAGEIYSAFKELFQQQGCSLPKHIIDAVLAYIGAAIGFRGLCFGMSSAVGCYWFDSSLKPYPEKDVCEYSITDPRIAEEIVKEHAVGLIEVLYLLFPTFLPRPFIEVGLPLLGHPYVLCLHSLGSHAVFPYAGLTEKNKGWKYFVYDPSNPQIIENGLTSSYSPESGLCIESLMPKRQLYKGMEVPVYTKNTTIPCDFTVAVPRLWPAACTTEISSLVERICEFFASRFAQFWESIYDFYESHLKDRIIVQIGSPVDVTIVDRFGRIINANINEIPNASYAKYLTVKSFYLPINNEYSLTVEGHDEGEVSINIFLIKNDEFFVYSYDFRVSQNSTAIINDVMNPLELLLDQDGDAAVDQTLAPYIFSEPIPAIESKIYISHGPNPVPPEGCIFWLNLPDDAVEATLKIFDVDGAFLVSIPIDPDADRYPETGRWTPQDNQGRLLGTGLYLYLVEIVHADGTVTYSPVQKMVIQR
ncbi:MAG: hypothetical protein JRJ29_19900, partial [Deltaproteobacteria bacterium]|nr:hypothetical protein [Deltaproteobacteria bacterium]